MDKLTELEESNIKDGGTVTGIQRELHACQRDLKELVDEVSKDTETKKQTIMNNPSFKKRMEEITNQIGITRPLPVIRFRPLKPTSEAQIQRYKQLCRSKQEQAVRFNPVVESEESPNLSRHSICSPSSNPNISFNMSNLSMFDQSVYNHRNQSSFGLLDIPESDTEDAN